MSNSHSVPPALADIFAYVDAHRAEYLERLLEYVRQPSISAHGVGIAETGFRIIEQWLTATLTLIEECPCEDGCPSCIQSPKCGNNNEPLDKKAAALILKRLLHGEPPSTATAP